MEKNLTSNFLDRLGNDLVQNDFITESQFEEAMDEIERTGNHLGEVLTGLKFIREDKLNEFLAERLNIPILNLDEYEADQELVSLIDKETAQKYKIIPLFSIEDVITVAMADPLNVFAIERIKGITNKVIEPVMASEKSILKAINDLWNIEDNISRVVDAMDVQGERVEEGEMEGEQFVDEAPVIKLVNSIIEEAIRENASDIHIEPERNLLRIRYRVDGVLREVSSLEKKLHSSLATRIKVMSGLDIGQRRIPQDGKAKFSVDGRNIDLRVSTYPVVYGEKVVLRILDTKNVLTDLGNLGLGVGTLAKYRELVKSNSGIILVTGPTGSGKTTTLYSTLNEINSEQLNITTIEDPREYEMGRVNQGQVDVKAGITFASALRSIVRQDPDIILVGEIRDLETAELAVRSALTGHLVFSTLHTNTAAGAVSRMLDMGIEPFLLASSVRGILGQRLVRHICSECKTQYEPLDDQLEILGLKNKQGDKFYNGKGCSNCRDSGYSGRIGIYELLIVNNKIRELILSRAPDNIIQEAAVENGMETMRRDGAKKILAGITTCNEVLRVS